MTHAIPASTSEATWWAVERFVVQMVVDKPYGDALASSTTSSISSNGRMWVHGPKISSLIVRASSASPVQIVGWIQLPFTKAGSTSGTPPPVTTVAPSSTARS